MCEVIMKKQVIVILVLVLGIAGLAVSILPSVGADIGDGYFYEDFEGSVFPPWTADGLWHLEDNDPSNWKILGWMPTPPHYIWYGQNDTTKGNYNTTPAINYGSLTSPLIDLTKYPGSTINISFQSWAETDGINDLKLVNISSDDGLTWNTLGIIPDTTSWEYFTFDITTYGNSSNVRIQFYFECNDFDNSYRGWMIDDINIESFNRFDLWIEQDNWGTVYETKTMIFRAHSKFDYGMYVNISMVIVDPRNPTPLWEEYKYNEYIGAWQDWSYSLLDHIFDETGYYEVSFTLIDENGGEWSSHCWFDIGDMHFGTWIEQDNYARVDETANMTFHVINHFNYPMDVTIEFFIQYPDSNEHELYPTQYVHLDEFVNWDLTVHYNFTETGRYMVSFRVYETGNKENLWEDGCWWQVYDQNEPYFALWIWQGCDIAIDKVGGMDFNVESRYYNSMWANIKIQIETPNDSLELLHQESVFMNPGDTWYYNLNYIFTEVGWYNVYLNVTDDNSKDWVFDCSWNVYEEHFELWIDQDNEARLHDERWMHFNIKSHFDRPIPGVTVIINIIVPNGNIDYQLKDTIYMSPHGHWDYDLSYVFNEVGNYKVELILIDDTDTEWYRDCYWNVYEDGDEPPPDDTDDKEYDEEDRITPGFEIIIIPLALIAVAMMSRKNRT